MESCLLDTHAFLWFIAGDSKLTENAKQAIIHPDRIKYISIASIWKMAIKISLGKLELKFPFERLEEEIIKSGFEILPLEIRHIQVLLNLELHHKDPFDRILISQAMSEKLSIVTMDGLFSKYNIQIIC